MRHARHQMRPRPSSAAANLMAVLLLVLGIMLATVVGVMAQSDDPYPAPPAPEFPVFSDDTATDAYTAPEGSSINVGGPSDLGGDVFVDPMLPDEMSAAETTPVAINPNGLLFLWLGFLVALLVFATSVIGSVLLFARRNEL